MKTAVSIPDDVFADAERLARRLKLSRSQLYSHALREYLSRHAPDDVTEALNRAHSDESSEERDFARIATRQRLRRIAW